jgi:hypothetical protein
MSRDADRKRGLLCGWWGDLLTTHAVRILDAGTPLQKGPVLERLGGLVGESRQSQSIYVLFVETEAGKVPVYVGRADAPLVRWGQHLDGWLSGVGPYARWRGSLLDERGRAREALTLLVVPVESIARPPIPGFPTSVGSVEYQLVALAEDAYPGRLLNHEGKGRR